MTIVLATHNSGKAAEIREIFPEHELKTLADLGITNTPEETGTTFLENARIKAIAAAEAAELPALADDSGLCVVALDGAPGVYSARFGGCKTDTERNAHLLEVLAREHNRAAAFVCAAVLRFPDGRELTAEGRLEGEILRAPQGENGFGYDPLFYLPDRGKTTAELTRDAKNALSHRGNAMRDISRQLSEDST